MKFTGFLIAIIGIFALVKGGLTYNRNTTLMDGAGMHVTSTMKRTLPIAPIVGALILLGGVGMMAVPKPRLA